MDLKFYKKYYNDSLSQRYVSEEEYSDFLEYCSFLQDKRVVLVAPSKSLMTSRQAALIESYDVVVRLNNGFLTDGIESSVGHRTDILFHGLNPKKQYRLRLKPCLEKGTSFISYWGASFNKVSRYKQQVSKKRLPVRFVHMGDRFQMYRTLGGSSTPKLLIGMGAAFHLSGELFEPKELLLCGFDFYETAHHPNCYNQSDKESFRRAHATHNITANKRFLDKLIKTRPWINLDSITSNALSL